MANTTGGDKVFTTPWTTDRHLQIGNETVASNTTYYSGQAVGRDGSGLMVQMDDTAKAEFLGFLNNLVRETVSSSDAASDHLFLVEQPLMFTALIASAAAGDEGRKVFWQYNNQVSYSPGSNANFAGWVWQVKDSTHVVILPPWMSHVTAGGDKGIYTAAAAANTTLTKWDINKVINLPLTSSATIYLPPAAKCSPGDTIKFINTSANSSTPTISPPASGAGSSDLINGAATYTMATAQYSIVTMTTDGVSNWYLAPSSASGTLGATTFTGAVALSSVSLTITNTSATSLAVGPNGSTNPCLVVACNVGSAATGISVTGRAAGAGVTLATISSGSNEDLLIAPKGTGNVKITSTGATGLVVGPNGSTNPVLTVVCNVSSEATGISITGAAAASGCAIAVTSSGTNENLTIDAKGSGTITFGSVSTGNILFNQGCLVQAGTGGIGYGTGVGGTVTQSTSKATGVTLNKLSGTITMNNASLATLTPVTFTLTNSTIAATDTVVVTIKSGATTNSYLVGCTTTAAGSCQITLFNASAGTLSEAVVLSFNVIKGVAA